VGERRVVERDRGRPIYWGPREWIRIRSVLSGLRPLSILLRAAVRLAKVDIAAIYETAAYQKFQAGRVDGMWRMARRRASELNLPRGTALAAGQSRADQVEHAIELALAVPSPRDAAAVIRSSEVRTRNPRSRGSIRALLVERQATGIARMCALEHVRLSPALVVRVAGSGHWHVRLEHDSVDLLTGAQIVECRVVC